MKEIVNTFIDIQSHSSTILNKNGLKLLDIGCGDCSDMFELYQLNSLDFDKLIGIDSEHPDWKEFFDLDPNITLDQTYKKYNLGRVKPIKCSGYTFLYINENEIHFLSKFKLKVDIILMCNFIHFFTIEEINQIISDSYRLLNENGILYVVTANNNHESGKLRTKLTLIELQNLLEKFEVIYQNPNYNNGISLEVVCEKD